MAPLGARMAWTPLGAHAGYLSLLHRQPRSAGSACTLPQWKAMWNALGFTAHTHSSLLPYAVFAHSYPFRL